MTTTNDMIATSLTVTSEIIRAYAELTNDYNPIHLDPDFAASTPMGHVIAHGTMSIGLLFTCIERTFPGVRFDDLTLDIKFTGPVYVGDKITAGGHRTAESGSQFDVWVRGQDDTVRLAGVLTLPAL